jgi:hypothetical protein
MAFVPYTADYIFYEAASNQLTEDRARKKLILRRRGGNRV